MKDYRDLAAFEINMEQYDSVIIEGYVVKYLGDGRISVMKSKENPVKLDPSVFYPQDFMQSN